MEKAVMEHITYPHAHVEFKSLDFSDAVPVSPPFGVNSPELNWLERINRAKYGGCDTKERISLVDSVKMVISDERSLNLDDYDLYVSSGGFREAFISVLGASITDKNPVLAYATPNWVFGKIANLAGFSDQACFHAESERDFVEGVEQTLSSGRVGALILSDPANPVGYRFSHDGVAELERLGTKYGSVIIFDDVFRGLEDKLCCDSASDRTKNSVIIETTSKRFGTEGIGLTWTLVPKSLDIVLPDLNIGCSGCENLAAEVLMGLYSTDYSSRVADMIATNASAYRRGLVSSLGDAAKNFGTLKHAFPGLPFMTYHLKAVEELVYDSKVVTAALGEEGVLVTSGDSWTWGGQTEEKKVFGLSYIRICPTKTSPQESFRGGFLTGETLKSLR